MHNNDYALDRSWNAWAIIMHEHVLLFQTQLL